MYADGNKTTELLKKFSQLKESSEQALEKLGELEAELAELEAQRAAWVASGKSEAADWDDDTVKATPYEADGVVSRAT